jgi:hypothetical protein
MACIAPRQPLKELLAQPRSAPTFAALGLDVDATVRDLVPCVAVLSERRLVLAVECLETDQEQTESLALLRLLRTAGELRALPSVDALDCDGFTALAVAATAGDLPSVHLVLTAGADPRVVDAHGRTALDYLNAACRAHCRCWGIGCKHEPVRKLLV